GLRPPLDFSIWSHFLFLQNSFDFHYQGLAGAWFGHLWSLAVEEQFYLLAPLAVRVIPPRLHKWVLAAVVLACILTRFYLRFDAHMAFELLTTRTVSRMDSLAIGMLAALLVRSESGQRWLGQNLSALRAVLALLAAGALGFFLFSFGSNSAGMQT